MGTSCAEINSHLLMCAERSRGALNVEGAVNESNNLALLLIYAFPLKHNHSVHHTVVAGYSYAITFTKLINIQDYSVPKIHLISSNNHILGITCIKRSFYTDFREPT